MPSRLTVVLVSLLYATAAVLFRCTRTYLTLKFRLQQLATPSRLTVLLVSLLLATPAVIFWIWLVTLPARVAVLCPEECWCDPGGYYVSCYSSSLTAVPSISLTGVRQLELYNNNITLLEREIFVSRGLTELEVLSVRICGLSTIELGAFKGLTELTELTLMDNKLSEITPGTFGNLINLEQLDLRGNRLQNLDSAVFSGLVNLQFIGLGGNKLQYLHPDTFLGLTKLQTLLLSDIPGLQIPTDRNFKKLHSLSRLDIANCNIHSVSVETFANLSALEYLDLSDNSLQHLDSDVFSGLVNLLDIHLGRNQLQYLHPDTFSGLPKLQNLYLYYNPDLQIPTDRNFINSHSLSRLVISYCNVGSVSVETFANVSALEHLDLRQTNLRTVDINILRSLPKLSELYLEGNPLRCDCQLQEVWRWCNDRNIATVYSEDWKEETVCDTPSELKGKVWGMLEKGQCLQGNTEYYGDYNSTWDGSMSIKFKYSDKYNVDILKNYQVPVYAVLFIFGTACNFIILIIITCNKDMRTVHSMYIINLATSDIIYLTVFFTEACANRISDRWLQGDFMCRFTPFCLRLSVGLSAYSVAVLSIQRYRVTVNPLHVLISSPPTWRAAVATICGVWIVAALFAVPSVLSKYLCDSFEVLVYRPYYQRVVLFELLVSCAIPFCVISFTYIMTALHLMKSSRSISEGTQNPQLNTRRTTAKIVVGLTVVFMISYVPYHIIWTHAVHTDKVKNFTYDIDEMREIISVTKELQYTYLMSIYLLLINPCLNPVALFCTSSPLRQHLKRCLTCCCKTNSPPADVELTRRN